MRGARLEEVAFAEGRGPNLATKDKTIGISGVEDDPLGSHGTIKVTGSPA
jgi:hypothetical protein